ncbi:MAG: hypothetical protein JNM62_16310 [Flavobacteriales bacterium]|nr:hypothetical protein [Flavobacteriales bacterium]
MSTRQDGRFCSSCQHEVADLTHATDNELLRLFGGDAEPPKCARFDPRQLDRVLRGPEERNAGVLPIAMFTSLLALLSGNESLGQHGGVVGKPMPERVDRGSEPRAVPEVGHASSATPRIVTVHGRMVNANTGLAMPDGFVRLWGGSREIQTYSDSTGRFSLVFEATADSTELFFGGPDRDPFTQFVSWARTAGSGPLAIPLGEVRMLPAQRMDPKEMMLGEVAVLRRPTWRFRSGKP